MRRNNGSVRLVYKKNNNIQIKTLNVLFEHGNKWSEAYHCVLTRDKIIPTKPRHLNLNIQ